MSTVIRDLWPEDIKSEDVISPEEVLEHQAQRLEARTNGLLIAHVVTLIGQDRTVIGFEVESPRAASRIRLFEVQHRLDYEYPVVVIPPDDVLPEFLRERVFHPNAGESRIAAAFAATSSALRMMGEGEWVKNKWVASSPAEFTELVQEVLAQPTVKAAVLSLLSRSNRAQPATGSTGEAP